MAVTVIDVSDLGKLITFGKHKGETWNHVLTTNPKYLLWVDENVEFIEFTEEVFEKIAQAKERQYNQKPNYYSGWGGWQNADDAGTFGDPGDFYDNF